nr:helix-hairpin-helix domain-containing protein [Salsipaludibacter albus]
MLGLALLVVGGVVLTVLVVGRVEGAAGGGEAAEGVFGVGDETGVAEGPSGSSTVDVASQDPSAGPAVGAGSDDVAGGTGGSDPGVGPTPGAAPVGVVVVHVTGAVVAPGVLELPAGARLVDAVDAAGGTTAEAATDVLNLAAELRDGQRLHVPTTVEAAAAEGDGSGSGTNEDGSEEPGPVDGQVDGGGGPTAPVDLNRAGTTELEALPGVGPVLAGRIVAWREEHGAFTSVGQLRDVSGIGEKTFQSLAPLVVVS